MAIDDKKVAFLSCVNDDEQYNEALYYISQLNLPPGFSLECLAVREARSMTQGYQYAMMHSNARYKVYLHQDVHIVHKDFVREIVEIFSNNPALGMLGPIGNKGFTASGGWWLPRNNTYGMVYQTTPEGKPRLNGGDEVYPADGGYEGAKMLDGLLLATQYDLPWRVDLFDNWHFYDVSQCCEFLRKGYEVGILSQYRDGVPAPWLLHYGDNGGMGPTWEHARGVFLQEYATLLQG